MATENQYLFITDLPEEILEIILAKLSPYRDLKSAKLVCKQWHRLVTGMDTFLGTKTMLRFFLFVL